MAAGSAPIINDSDEWKSVGGASGRGTTRVRAFTLPAQVDKEALMKDGAAQLSGRGTYLILDVII